MNAKDELKFATIVGELFVMIYGEIRMQMLSAGSWDFLVQVCQYWCCIRVDDCESVEDVISF